MTLRLAEELLRFAVPSRLFQCPPTDAEASIRAVPEAVSI